MMSAMPPTSSVDEDDGDVAEQIALDRLVHREPDDARRNDRDDELLQHLEVEEAIPVEDDDGEDGAELDDDLEALEELRLLDAERVTREDEVRGRGDREELGDPFDDRRG